MIRLTVVLEYYRLGPDGPAGIVTPKSEGAHGWIHERVCSWLGEIVRRHAGKALIVIAMVLATLLGYGDGLSPFASTHERYMVVLFSVRRI